ncbi:signal peptidase complex subunit SPC2, putative [Plasmodium ovale]|uniref:Signal peptidase complex subunit 2 n=1 Tax=Plasmodium ovale TaxID=36330 RepID=A0A1C3KRL8_PLAOA|nr:signal peptidase complex subunit SPC2, putative [Plasmodium ovale]
MPTKNVEDENKESTYQVNNLYSEHEIKKVTQDYISEKIRGLNVDENVYYSNIRIMLCLMLVFIGSYCCVFVKYKKQPFLMIKLLVVFFALSIVLFLLEFFFFEDVFIILKTNNGGLVRLYFQLDVKKSSLCLAYKWNKKIHCTYFELGKLFNENGYLIQPYADNTLKQFITDHGKIFKLKDDKKKS